MTCDMGFARLRTRPARDNHGHVPITRLGAYIAMPRTPLAVSLAILVSLHALCAHAQMACPGNPPGWIAAPPHAAVVAPTRLASVQAARSLPAGQAPPMQLAQSATAQQFALAAPIARHWVSEKYDGVRAWWDGHSLRTRQGHRIAAPTWFTANWPKVAMDGELWAGRGQFETASGTVQSLVPNDAAWQAMRFLVFDLPEQPLPFGQRLGLLRQLQSQAPNHVCWRMVPQWRVSNLAELHSQMRQRHAQGAEGLMLHDSDALHASGRTAALLKYKPLDDAEAEVIGHVPGKGKHAGRLGALVVRQADGVQFRIGTGFTDQERAAPPAIGQVVTYTHHGFTAKGLPRFASFVRVRSNAGK